MGFSLIDAMVGAALTMGLVLSVLLAADIYQKTYSETQSNLDLQQRLRGVSELLAQEIGQAGLLGLPEMALTAPVQASPTPREIPVQSSQGLFAGEKVILGWGADQEPTVVEAVGYGSFTASVSRDHPEGTAVTALGVFAEGVLADSSPDRLRIFGDLRGDGGLELVEYECDLAAGALTRTATPIGSLAPSKSLLLRGLKADPAGEPCFRLTTLDWGGWSFVTEVEVTLTVESETPNPRTGAPLEKSTRFKAASRNVATALRLTMAGKTDRVQPTPPEFQSILERLP